MAASATTQPALSIIDNTSEVIDFVVNKGNGVKGLSDLGLKTVPNAYMQPHEERPEAMPISQESIPIIDMSNWDDPAVVESICAAARRFGFFQIINHGIPAEVCDGIKQVAHRFFELPAEEKLNFSSNDNVPGNAVKFGTSFSPSAEKVLEWRDFLSLKFVSEEVASEFWPSVCKDQALKYYERSETVMKSLANALMKGLNVKGKDENKEPFLTSWTSVVLNYYPTCPNPEVTAGVSRHSDISAFTILLQDDVGGLYVRAVEDGAWIHVPPKEGALVINIGDALQILSNGQYKSIEHRVVTSSSKNRVSVATFVSPSPNEAIGPLPEVLLADGAEAVAPVYRQVIYSDYCRHYFGKGLDGKKAIEWATI